MKFLNNLVKLFRGKDDGLNGVRYLALVLPLGYVLLKIFTVLGDYVKIHGIGFGFPSPGAVDMSVLAVSILAMALIGGWAGGVVFMSREQGKRGVK